MVMLFKKPNAPPGEAGEPPAPPLRTAGESPENPFALIAAELSRLHDENALPPDFDLEQACQDPAFARLLDEFPPAAAVRVYAAEELAAHAEERAMQTLAARQMARESLPRPQNGTGGVAAATDYSAMSPAAFRALEAQMKAAARNGKKIRL